MKLDFCVTGKTGLLAYLDNYILFITLYQKEEFFMKQKHMTTKNKTLQSRCSGEEQCCLTPKLECFHFYRG